jgi:GT2 family glycosyltransferase
MARPFVARRVPIVRGGVLGSPSVRVSVIVVTYRSAPALEALLPALERELEPQDELIIVDNDGSAEGVAATVLRNADNVGFAAACNQGAAAATGDLLVFLNPDAIPQPGFRAAIADGHGFDAWMGLVLDGDRINTSGGVVHFTAIAWAGHAEPAVREVGFLSGACLAVPRARWLGFSPEFFMYHEDVDLSLRLRLAGARIGVVPDAVVDHDYAFAKGQTKWRMLERNRWATILRTYPTRLLVLTAPALLGLEIALWPAAVAGGWAGPKARATADVLRSLPRLLRERRAIQAGRTISGRAFADGLTAELSSPYLGAIGRNRVVAGGLRAYWALVRALL